MFDYDKEILTQNRDDLRKQNISAVFSALLATPEGNALKVILENSYSNDLKLPSSAKLIAFIKSTFTSEEALQSLIQAHGTIEDLANDCIATILKEKLEQTFIVCFEKQVLNKLSEDKSLNAHQLVESFLAKHKGIFNNLAPSNQKLVRECLLFDASKAIVFKLNSFYYNIVNKHLSDENIRAYLLSPYNDQMDSNLTATDIVFTKILRRYMNTNSDMKDAIKHFNAHNKEGLNHLINRKVEAFVKTIKDATIKHITSTFDESFPDVASIASYKGLLTIENNKPALKPLKDNMLQKILPAPVSSIFTTLVPSLILNYSQVNSCLGNLLAQDIRDVIYNLAIARLDKVAQVCVDQIFVNDAIKADLMKKKPTEDEAKAGLEKMHDAVSLTELVIGLSNYLQGKAQGKAKLTKGQETLIADLRSSVYKNRPLLLKHTGDSYSPMAYLITQILLTRLNLFYKKELSKLYAEFSDYLVTNNQELLKFGIYAKDPNRWINYLLKMLVAYVNKKGGIPPQFLAFCDMESAAHQEFSVWFSQNTKANIISQAKELTQLNQSVINIKSVLDVIRLKNRSSVNENFLGNLNTQTLMAHLESLGLLQERINHIHLIEKPKINLNQYEDDDFGEFDVTDITENAASLQSDLSQKIKELLRNLMNEQYQIGEIKPGTYTTILRPYLCQLLGIKTPHILSIPRAKKWDEEINLIIKVNVNSRIDFSIMCNEPNLFGLSPQVSLPTTDGKWLTKELVIKCIAYWQTNYDWSVGMTLLFENDQQPGFVRHLIKVVNDDAFDARGVMYNMAVTELNRLLNNYTKDPLPDSLANQLKSALKITSELKVFNHFPGQASNWLGGLFDSTSRYQPSGYETIFRLNSSQNSDSSRQTRELDESNPAVQQVIEESLGSEPQPKLRRTTSPIKLELFQSKPTQQSVTVDPVITTRSGYVLNINDIAEKYKKERLLVNPHSQEPYSHEDLEDICQHPQINLLACHIMAWKVKDTLKPIEEELIDIAKDKSQLSSSPSSPKFGSGGEQ